MRSATSSSLRVCAESAICSANSRLLEARVPVDHDRGPRRICTVPLARPVPRLCTPPSSAPHASAPSSAPCIPLHPSAPAPLHPHLCTPTFARCQRSKTPQPLKDTAMPVYSNARGVPEQAAAAPPAPPYGKWHRNSQMAPAYRCHLSNAVPLRGRTARNGTASTAERVVRPHRWRAHPTLRPKTPQSLRDTAIAVSPSNIGVPEQAGSRSAARRCAPPPLPAHLHAHLCVFASFVRVLPHTIDANPHGSGS